MLLQLLGRPSLTSAGDAASQPLAAERAHQLLAYLACRGDWVSRDSIATLLWPEIDQTSARRNLRKIVFRAHGLPWASSLETRPDALRWVCDTDLKAFDAALARGDWRAALGLYRGPLLDGFEHQASEAFEAWLRFERARLAASFRRVACERLVELRADAAACTELATHWLALEPFDEDALTALVDAYRQRGRLAEARSHYRDFVDRLAERLGVEPSTRLRSLASALDSPNAAPTSAARPAATPSDPEALVGRRLELRTAAELLAQPDCRVLTITGPGGIGKSRLARAVLSTLADRFPDGRWSVALDDLSDGAQVAPRLAAALQLDASAAADPFTLVVERLRDCRSLLMLDDSEHLPELAPLAVRLLQACPGIKLLNTSRERWSIPGEWLLPLDGMPVPDADETELAALAAFDSMRLFELRARAAAPSFSLADQAADVAALVRALDGMPLAIELAAAWVHLLPASEIAADVRRSLDLLERAEGGTPRPEHRGVRATFEPSWRRLAGSERDVMAALSVLRAPFSRHAAQAVADATLAHLASLADKSLIRGDGRGRFSMHALIAQFAAEKLALDAAARQGAQRRHAEHFCRSLQAYSSWHTIDQKDAIARVGLELADILAACRWAFAEHRADLALTAIGVLGYFFEWSGRLDEGLALLHEAERAFNGSLRTDWLVRGQAALSRSMIHYRAARFGACVDDAKLALRCFRTAHDGTDMRYAMGVIASGLTKTGQYDAARRYCEQGLRAAEQAGEADSVRVFLNNLALVESQCGHPERAVPLYERALDATRTAGDLGGIVAQLNNLGAALIHSDRPAQALPPLEEGLRLVDEAGFVAQRSYFLANLAQACMDLGDLRAARSWAEQGLESLRHGSDRSSEPGCLIVLGRVEMAEGRSAQARQRLAQAARVAQAMRLQRFRIRAAIAYAQFSFDDGSPLEAVRVSGCVQNCGAANCIEQLRVEKLLAGLREQLDPASFDEALDEGRGRSLDEALARIANAA